MQKTCFNVTQESLSKLLGISEQELLKLLRNRLPSHDGEHEDFISLFHKLIKD
ncbi:hypothetical protein [Paenibacillus sp. FSL H3-0457]|uniref:hypothetical protein n=1 Tax=Paenibacillus sp. FSL H3-0457 TaxID=2921430 RepID=UPI0030EE91BA